MKKIGKYEFANKAQADTAITALGVGTDEEGNSYPTHGHTIARLGNIVTTPGVYDEEGEETTAPVLSSGYHVDVLWKGLVGADIVVDGEITGQEAVTHPEGWGDAAVDVTGDGVHGFMGLDYGYYKI